MNQIKLFKITEIIGILTLGLVVHSLLTHSVEPNILRTVGLVLATVSLVTATFYQFLHSNSFNRVRVALAGFLLLFSGYVFYFSPEYFQYSLGLNLTFWDIVSVYSLPAIALEGAIFTLLDQLSYQYSDKRSRRLISFMFVFYAFFAVATNFAAIAGTIQISHQILFSRAIWLLVIISTGIYVVRRGSSQEPN
jgi:predicted membrane protein